MCTDAQKTADSLYDNVGSTSFDGYVAVGDHISQDLRCPIGSSL
jgi:hypothetical protein